MRHLIKRILSEESKRNSLHDYIARYVNDTFNEGKPTYVDSYIIIWDYSNYGDDADDEQPQLFEYDNYDGRLWVSENYMNRLKNIIPLSTKEMYDIFKHSFEKRFGVEVSFVES
jgi:hypothetical protein